MERLNDPVSTLPFLSRYVTRARLLPAKAYCKLNCYLIKNVFNNNVIMDTVFGVTAVGHRILRQPLHRIYISIRAKSTILFSARPNYVAHTRLTITILG
jgi:hypothetical protein